MRNSKLTLGGLSLLVLGVLFGRMTAAPELRAQQESEDESEYTQEVVDAYIKANKGVRELTNLFVASGKTSTAFGGMNYFAASVGGIDAERDLEEGRGVDPETFAALYADQASPKISEHLDFDAEGRLRYKKTVIRIYSRERLKQLFQRRENLEARAEAQQ